MLRKIAATLLGVIVAFIVVGTVEYIGHQFYPPPADLDYQNTQVFTKYVETLPIAAFLFVIAAWALGAFVGSVVARKVAGHPSVIYCIIITGMVLLASIMNLVIIPHPTWFAIVAITLVFLAGGMANYVSRLFDGSS